MMKMMNHNWYINISIGNISIDKYTVLKFKSLEIKNDLIKVSIVIMWLLIYINEQMIICSTKEYKYSTQSLNCSNSAKKFYLFVFFCFVSMCLATVLCQQNKIFGFFCSRSKFKITNWSKSKHKKRVFMTY